MHLKHYFLKYVVAVKSVSNDQPDGFQIIFIANVVGKTGLLHQVLETAMRIGLFGMVVVIGFIGGDGLQTNTVYWQLSGNIDNITN
jgi:hypothetical protein